MTAATSTRIGVFSGARPLMLSNLQASPNLQIVALAPHPDDFEAISVIMRWFHVRGHRMDVAVLTTGASGVEDGYRNAVTNEAKRDVREAEQRASCRLFGLAEDRLTFLRLKEDPAGNLEDSVANREQLRSYYLTRRPDMVCLPHGHDTNLDHQRTASFFREIAGVCHDPVVAFYSRDPKTLGMRTDLLCDFNADDAKWKGALLRCHDSQHQRNLNTRGYGFDERVLRVNRQMGEEFGCAYAEAFEVENLNGAQDVLHLIPA